LQALVEQAPSARAARLCADLEEAELGDGAAARQWLRQAAILPADAAWVCQSCGSQSGDWVPHCPECGSFDALTWRQPPGAGAVLPYLPSAAETDGEGEILPPDDAA
jgi:HemY protein